MKRLQQGFTLIELMIVVAIVGILAAIALPAYQDYVVRSKISEAEAAMAACKTSVAEYTSTHAGTMPATIVEAGCSQTTTQYVNGGVNVTNGIIDVTTQNTGATPNECHLTLTPSQAATFEITQWTGSNDGSCSSKFVPSTFR